MEPIFALIAIVGAFLALDVAALAWGSDSRDELGDSHSRPTVARGDI